MKLPVVTCYDRGRPQVCYDVHGSHNIACQKTSCPMWVNNPRGLNCVVCSVRQDGEHSLQQIGDMFGRTRAWTNQLLQGTALKPGVLDRLSEKLVSVDNNVISVDDVDGYISVIEENNDDK